MKLLVVLGNKLNDDATMSEALKKRLEKTVKVAEGFDKLIVTGGKANPKAGISEAEVMREYLIASGVCDEKIICEKQSLSTKQNALFSAPLIASLGVNRLWLLSSKQHINRPYLNPVKLFRTSCNGIEIIPIEA